MPRRTPQSADSPLQRELRRLGWALVIYGVLVLALGVWAVRLGITHRRFDPLTVSRAADSLSETAEDGTADSAPAVQQVRGELP